jgi:septum formation protein
VVLGNQVLGKPHSHEEAAKMLHSLSGRVHQVYTGVCLRSAERSVAFTERTDVHFRQMSDSEIEYYIDHYKPYDKAGAYGIQEWIGMVGIERIEGCYYNVMGLPVARLYRELMSLIGRSQ